jgi:hypothetical protein
MKDAKRFSQIKAEIMAGRVIQSDKNASSNGLGALT